MPYGIELAKAAGGAAAGNFVNEGMGLIFQGIKNKQQLQQQRRLSELDIMNQTEMMKRSEEQQMRMWKNTSYPAQIEMMKKAGLNPGLMYGMGGGGGATTGGTPAHAGGAAASIAQASRGSEGMGMMIGQMGLLEAQRKNIEADTKLKEVDAAKKAGVDTEEAKGRIENLRLNNDFLGQTLDYRVDIVHSEMSKLINELTLQDGSIERERSTRTADITKARAEAVNTILTSQLIKANTENTKQSTEESKATVSKIHAEIEKISNEIALNWQTLDVRKLELQLKAWEADIKAKYPGLWNVFGRILNETANGIGTLINQKPDTEKNPIKQ